MGRVLTNNTNLAYSIEASGSLDGTLQGNFAVGRLVTTGQPSDTNTVVINGKTYTYQTVLTDVDGNVQIGADATESINNLIAAINLGAGAGTAYAASTTINADVSAAKGTGDTMVVTAKTAGTGPNAYATTETHANGAWDNATLEGGTNPIWKQVEPNDISAFGAEIRTVARSPISKLRQRRAGTIVDLDSSVELEADWIKEHALDLIEGFLFSVFNGPLHLDRPNNELTVAAGGYNYLPIAGSALAANLLVYARGFTNSVNNGLKVVDSASTDIFVDIVGGGLTVETPAATVNASVDVCGVRGATGDLQIDASGDLISSALDFTTLGLTVGQFIHIGGSAAANKFATAANFGRARVTVIAANKLTLDKKLTTFTVDNGAGKDIDVYFGRFGRNVSVDDADYENRQFQWEAAWDGLGDSNEDAYEYALGNYCDTVSFNLPLTDKATMTVAFVGTDTQVPTTSRKSGASAPVLPEQTEAFNTSADLARLRVTQTDETGITTDFKSMTLTLNNNVSPEKVLAQLGAKYMNNGIFEVDLEAQLIFSSTAVPTAIRNNTTVTMDFLVTNNDGGMMVDIPSMKLGGGDKELPVNESVLVNLTGQAFVDSTLQTSIGVSMFPFLPSS